MGTEPAMGMLTTIRGSTAALTVVVQPPPVAHKPQPVTPRPTPVAPAPQPRPVAQQTLWPWVVGGTGIALVVTGLVVRSTAGSALAEVDERLAKDAVLAPPYTLHPSVTQRELDDAIARRDSRLVTGGWLVGVGLAATATGAALWWRERPTTAWVQPLWSPQTAGVAVAGRF